MQWAEVLADPSLQDLPYKIELNEFGQILMTPASNRHGWFQVEIAAILREEVGTGRVISECSVDTRLGVKVADVAWLSDEFVAQHGHETPFTRAPQICVEIRSPSNSGREFDEKKELYFEQGAQEVWLCDESGQVEFFVPNGKLDRSLLVPGFTDTIG
ncbi:MAG: Uma2 family endonuclease [Pirellulales bacterium]